MSQILQSNFTDVRCAPKSACYWCDELLSNRCFFFWDTLYIHFLINKVSDIYFGLISHASGLTEAAEIWPIEFQNKQAFGFRPVDGRPHPVSVSMDPASHLHLPLVWLIGTSSQKNLFKASILILYPRTIFSYEVNESLSTFMELFKWVYMVLPSLYFC